jgi:hypothetical protein
MRVKMWMGAQDRKKTRLTRSNILFIFFILTSFLAIPWQDMPVDVLEEMECETLIYRMQTMMHGMKNWMRKQMRV